MLIRIYLKSGNVLPDFPCDEFTVKRNAFNFVGYEYKGGKNPRPLYVDIDQIEAICRVDTTPMPDSNLVDELKQELARAMFYISAQKNCDTCKHEMDVAHFSADCVCDCDECSGEPCAHTCKTCQNGSNWEWRGLHG